MSDIYKGLQYAGGLGGRIAGEILGSEELQEMGEQSMTEAIAPPPIARTVVTATPAEIAEIARRYGKTYSIPEEALPASQEEEEIPQAEETEETQADCDECGLGLVKFDLYENGETKFWLKELMSFGGKALPSALGFATGLTPLLQLFGSKLNGASDATYDAAPQHACKCGGGCRGSEMPRFTLDMIEGSARFSAPWLLGMETDAACDYVQQLADELEDYYGAPLFDRLDPPGSDCMEKRLRGLMG